MLLLLQLPMHLKALVQGLTLIELGLMTGLLHHLLHDLKKSEANLKTQA